MILFFVLCQWSLTQSVNDRIALTQNMSSCYLQKPNKFNLKHKDNQYFKTAWNLIDGIGEVWVVNI